MLYKTDETIICLGDARELAEPTAFERAYGTLSSDRKNKTDKLKFDKDKRLSVTAELTLAKALREYGVSFNKLCYEYGEHGKPALKKECILNYDELSACGKEVHFNLSHSGDYVMCAVGPYEVGCDIERIRNVDAEKLGKYFSDKELCDIMSQETEEEKMKCFFGYWTMRESYVKAVGDGLSHDMKDFEISRDDCGRAYVNRKDCILCELKMPEEYCGALCRLKNV